jgi:imidazoleglycerol-phosphate dehydratase/histidinol-phosphatase
MSKRILFVVQQGGLLEPGAKSPAHSPSKGVAGLRLRRECLGALRRFADAGYQLVLLVDPTSGDSAGAQTFLLALLESQGLRFADVRQCRHRKPRHCDCALPGIGLVDSYIADPGLDRDASRLVGSGKPVEGLARAMGLAVAAISKASGWTDLAHKLLDRPRRATIHRKTRETDIAVSVDLDSSASARIVTGIGFFDHMLEQLSKHGGFELEVSCRGDLQVDEHHTVEDVAIAVGQALKEALGDKRGIGRYGFVLPMDEAQARVAIDLSGRGYAVFEGEFPRAEVGGLPTELVIHFFRSLGDSLGAAIQIDVQGENAHHMVEACFKGVARALRQAIARTGSELPTTKGML